MVPDGVDESIKATFAPGSSARLNGYQSRCFFLGEAWLDQYFENWRPENLYGSVHVNGHHKDYFGVLSRGPRRGRLPVQFRSLGFNEATEPLLENLTLEFNGFLSLEPGSFSSASDMGGHSIEKDTFFAFLGTLLGRRDWDELRLSALDLASAETVEQVCASLGLICTVFDERLTYWVDLDAVRQGFQGNYLASLSANTRSQLRRARKTTEAALGGLELRLADSSDEAHRWFEQLGVLHKKRWNESEGPLGFTNPRFVRFHQEAIDRLWPQGKVHLVRLSSPKGDLAFLHNFSDRGHIYFNMTGVDYELGGASKPGMLAHWLAIEQYLQSGARLYDFLAGTNQYKSSLASHQATQRHYLIRRKRWFFVLEDWARQVKRSRAARQARLAGTD